MIELQLIVYSKGDLLLIAKTTIPHYFVVKKRMNDYMLWNLVQKQLDKQSMSIYRLSKLTGILDNTLYSYSRGISEPSFTNMVKIADVLGVSLDEFRSGKGNG